MLRHNQRQNAGERRGATMVEMAVVMPVFAVFLCGIMEFGHAFLVVGTLNAAAKQAARYGAVDGITTAEAVARANSILNAAFPSSKATIAVKNAGVFDSASPPTTVDYAQMPVIELKNAARRQLYVVRIEVAYNDVAIMPPFWAKNLTLTGQSVMRHE